MAEGLLIILLNRATKLSSYFLSMDKEYLAEIRLGLVTDTWDKEGKILKKAKPKKFEISKIKRAINGFRGENLQTPPLFSAIKYKGRPLYSYARSGEKAEIRKRKIKIYDIELIDYSNDKVRLKIVCSSGTYVRWIANEIGQVLGCGAILNYLERKRIGPFKLESALDSEKIEDYFQASIMGIRQSLSEEKDLSVYDKYYNNIKNGKHINKQMVCGRNINLSDLKPGDIIKINNENGELLAVHRVVEQPYNETGFSKPVLII